MSDVGKVPPPTAAPAAMRLDAATRSLVAQPLDRATRIELEQFNDILDALGIKPDGLDPPSLAAAVLTFVMPRLSDPGILRLDRRRAILNRILDAERGTRPGQLAVRHELRNIEMLRRNRDSLVEG